MITRDQNGATAVEFALILPLLILLIFGIIEFGLLLYDQQILTNACREGARAGVVIRSPSRLSNPEIQTVVKNYAKKYLVTFGSDTLEDADIGLLTINNDSTTFNPATDRCTSYGCDLKVAITYKYDFLVLSNLGFGQKTLNPVSIMRME
ncbi:MAG: TadE/TadG family type IV pilus assembly protein [Candidatus Heimdallarchaeota archaeon]